MAQEKNFVTKEGLERLKEEYNHLVHVEDPKVIQELAEARAQGDLSENADYDAAREKQAQIHARIAELEIMIKNAVIIGEDRSDAGTVAGIGSKVTILDLADNVEETLEKIIAYGGSVVGEIVKVENHNNTGKKAMFVYARDIEGNILELQSWG